MLARLSRYHVRAKKMYIFCWLYAFLFCYCSCCCRCCCCCHLIFCLSSMQFRIDLNKQICAVLVVWLIIRYWYHWRHNSANSFDCSIKYLKRNISSSKLTQLFFVPLGVIISIRNWMQRGKGVTFSLSPIQRNG